VNGPYPRLCARKQKPSIQKCVTPTNERPQVYDLQGVFALLSDRNDLFFRIIVKEIVAENNPVDASQTVSLKAPAAVSGSEVAGSSHLLISNAVKL